MIEPKAVKMVTDIWRLAGFLGVIPYKWDSKLRKMEFIPTQSRVAVVTTGALIYFVYEIFLIVRAIHAIYCDSTARRSEKVMLVYTLVASMVALSMTLCTFQHYGGQGLWVTRFLRHFDALQKLVNSEIKRADCTRFMKLTVRVGIFVVSVNFMGMLRRPYEKHLLTSLVYDARAPNLMYLVPMWTLNIFCWGYQWVTMCVYLFMVLINVQGIVINNRFLRIMENQGWNRTRHRIGHGNEHDRRWKTGGGNMYTMKQLVHHWRILNIIQADLNEIWQYLALRFQVIIMGLAVMGLYGAVRMPGVLGARMASVGFLALVSFVVLFKQMAQICDSSLETRESWGKLNRNAYFRRFLRSARPNRMTIGRFYYADSAMVLTGVQTILDATVNMVVTMH